MDSPDLDDVDMLLIFKSRIPNVALGLTLVGLPAALLGTAFAVLMPFWAAGTMLSLYCAARPMWDRLFPLRRSTLWALALGCLAPMFSFMVRQAMNVSL